MTTIQRQLANSTDGTVVHSDQFDLRPGTMLQIHVMELLFDDDYLANIAHDMISFFAQMEVLDLIYHQCFFTANSLGQPPTISQYFQPLTPQASALASADIHCALSIYAIAMNATVMLSQD
jgi:hypothetical protein